MEVNSSLWIGSMWSTWHLRIGTVTWNGITYVASSNQKQHHGYGSSAPILQLTTPHLMHGLPAQPLSTLLVGWPRRMPLPPPGLPRARRPASRSGLPLAPSPRWQLRALLSTRAAAPRRACHPHPHRIWRSRLRDGLGAPAAVRWSSYWHAATPSIL